MNLPPDRLHRLLEDQLEDCCDTDVERRLDELEGLAAGLPDPEETAADRKALGTMGDGTRHRLVRLLGAADRELCVCEITPLVEVSDSAVSHALGDLIDAGLATRRKEGTWHYYTTTPRADRLLEALDTARGAERAENASVEG